MMGRLSYCSKLSVTVGTCVLLAACGTNSSGLKAPKPATSLPQVHANLTVSGAINGSITDVRLINCGSQSAGTISVFYAAIYFEDDGQWYDLELNGVTRLPETLYANSFGYSGPGLYSANAYLRAMDLYPGGMVSSGSAWGMPQTERPTINIGSGQASVTLGSTPSGAAQLSLSDHLVLWPVKPGSLDPPLNSHPGPDSIVVLSGSWNCY